MLGTYLQKIRKEGSYSQDTVAKVIGIAKPTYILIEQNKRDLTTNELRKVADFFGLSAVTFMNGGNPNPELTIIPNINERKVENTLRISVPEDKIEKFLQVLLYILNKVGGKPNVGMTVLYKLLYFIDFDYYEKYKEQLMGLTYIKNHYRSHQEQVLQT